MTTVDTTLPPALQRALDLFIDPPAEPEVSEGYLDLVGTSHDDGPAKNTGPIQAVWASPIGSFLYDNVQALSRRFLTALRHPVDWLNIPQGGVALDVGCGPGSVTASLAETAGPDGRCWRARSALTPDRRSASCGPTRNGSRCGTTPSMRPFRSRCCS
jgi:arsenite methyltransferase